MGILELMDTVFEDWSALTVLVRLILSVVLGSAIGLFRTIKKRGAGFKTHSVVCLGSALIMLTAQYIYIHFPGTGDIGRLPAQVVSGVGFLGVGTIIVTGHNHIKGLTTAAGLWTCAGIGIATGIGFYSGAIIATVMILLIYAFLGKIDDFAYERSKIMDIYIEFANRRSVAPFVVNVKKQGYKIMQMSINKSNNNKEDVVSATIVMEAPVRKEHSVLVHEINGMEGVVYVEEI